MDQSLPGVLLSGASGLVGRNFIRAARGRYRLFCLARRSMEEAGIQPDDNLRWLQVDIGERDKLLGFAGLLRSYGGVQYVVNLAGYYDFSNQEHPEYTRTNIHGTHNMLDLAKELEVERFVFASSQAACPFGVVVSEETAPTATMPYAQSKRAGEELLHRYAQHFPCTIVRIAAVFSDWCEYPPLYTLLNNWLSGKMLETRILAGQGLSGVPYIHVQDLAQCLLRILEKSDELPQLCIVNAGPDGTATHLDLFRIATRSFYGKNIQPLFTPTWLLAPMIIARRVLSRLQGKIAFEQLWMLRYVDEQLIADSTASRKLLAWRPTPRKHITRRLVFLIENMQKNPDLWRSWNEAMVHKTANRPQLMLHEEVCTALESCRDEAAATLAAQASPVFNTDTSFLQTYFRLLCQLINTIIRTRNRPMMQQYACSIAFKPVLSGVGMQCASQYLFDSSEFLIAQLRHQPHLHRLIAKADEYLVMIVHMAVDQVEDQFELLRLQSPVPLEGFVTMPLLTIGEVELVIRQLEGLSREVVAGISWSGPVVQVEQE